MIRPATTDQVVTETTDTPQEPHQVYRSRKKAVETGAIKNLPTQVATITAKPYQNAISTIEKSPAHLQPIMPEMAEKLRFEDSVLYFEGVEASQVSLVQYFNKTPQAVSEIDLPTIRALYSVILADAQKMLDENRDDPEKLAMLIKDPQYLSHNVKIYAPDFMRMIGLPATSNKANIAAIIKKITDFSKIIGVLEEKVGNRVYHSLYPVMLWVGYNDTDGTFTFSSPYMNVLIARIASQTMRLDNKGNPRLAKNGKPLPPLPAYSYLVNASITSERNKRAVEIVNIVVRLIEQAGDKPAHIKAQTIIDQCPELSYALGQETLAHRNQILKRAFSRAWILLRTQTRLEQVYKNIKLPDPKTDIPTNSTLDMVFTFPHEGK